MNTFWRRLFAPEVIFTASAVAALSPYVLWYWGYKLPVVAHLQITYIPAILWGCGLLSFLVGCRLARKKRVSPLPFKLRQKNIPVTLLLCFGVVLVVVQAYLAIRDVYGAFPLMEYLSGVGNLDVGIANDQQQYSASGQFGLLTASLYALNSLFLIFIIERITRGRGSRVVLALAFVVTTITHLLNAKRGGLYSALFYLLVGLSLYFGDPVRALSALFPWRSRIVTKSILLGLAVALVFAFGYLASVRTRGRVEASPSEIIAYLEYPLANMEEQCVAAGFGPGDFRILSPFKYLTPFKDGDLVEAFALTNPRLVRDSPSGIYELIHWCWGMPGVILFSMVLGFMSRWLYERTLQSLTCLLSYCYFAVALAFAHTANQFLIHVYVPVPILFVCALRLLLSTERTRVSAIREGLAPGPAMPGVAKFAGGAG